MIPVSSAFQPGQRWISASEPELGLGEVRRVGARTVTLFFAAAQEMREYVQANAPLRRAAFRAGDTVRAVDGRTLVVDEVTEANGVLSYTAGGSTIAETALSPTLSFSSPPQRLYAGIFDPPGHFDVRLAAVMHQHARRRSPVRGFLGGRIALLPHQIGIASEVAGRLLPRVLLADEVGLGKTIEACLILHRLLLTGRASRVLILVQESLTHQWFLELLRRFNIWCHIFDEARCAAIEEGTPGANPFLEQQLILADIALLARDRQRLAQALEAGWDLLIVDEAHHLRWSPTDESADYAAVAALSARIDGLLLLTATPEQLGVAGHFARLRLLDPHRFHDLDAFLEESARYLSVADTAEPLLRAVDSDGDPAAREALDRLLDQHGTGRVMFRNTRAAVAGFPSRLPVLHQIPLDAGDTTRQHALAREWEADLAGAAPAGRRAPSLTADPRIAWLLTLIRTIAPDKVLLICRSDWKALAVEAAIKDHAQVKMAAFHERLSLVQRDRAAAWFAEPDGARLLICSEIGSEGRNFQFAHHLVLFDLPLDPAVLEQRIGRLDRIGQRHDVTIHVPVVQGTHLEVLARWYHEGLNALAENLQGSRELLEVFEPRLRRLAGRPTAARAELPAFIADVQASRQDVSARLERGRDRLLEWQSFKPAAAAVIIDEIRRLDDDRALDEFLLHVLDLYVIEVEEVEPRTYRIGSAGVLVDDFPGLSADRVTATCDRQRALAREDLQFLTWDHPLATGAIDALLGSDRGNCSFGRWVDARQELYLEAVFVIECIAPPAAQADRFLPPTPLRCVIDRRGNDATSELPAGPGRQWLEKQANGRELLGNERIRDRMLPAMLERAHAVARERCGAIVAEALATMRHTLERETTRLRELQAVNPAVRQEEIEALVRQRDALDAHLVQARPRLDAIRLVYRGPAARSGSA